MPWLVALLGSLVGSLIGWLMKFFTKKVSIILGFTSVFLVSLAVFVSALESLLAALYYVLPPGLNTAFSWVIPGNFSICLSVIISARIAKWVWELTMHKFDLLFLGGWG